MIERIFLYVDGSAAARRAARWAISRAKEWQSRLYVLHVVDTRAVVALARRTGRARRKIEDKLEEEGWRNLYAIEDDAFESEVKISLIMENGLPRERISELAKSYEADLVVVGYNPAVDHSKLIKHSSCTVVVIK